MVAGEALISGRFADSQIRTCSVTLQRPSALGEGRLEFVVTPAAFQRRRVFSSDFWRGLTVACALTALSATLATAAAEAAEPIPPVQVELSPFNDKEFLAARKSGSPVGLYFEADWCVPCKQMHARTLMAPAVIEAAKGIRFFRVDMTTPSHYVDLVRKSFQVLGAPTVILFGPDGKESGRRFGYVPPGEFLKMLSDARKPSPGAAAGST